MPPPGALQYGPVVELPTSPAPARGRVPSRPVPAPDEPASAPRQPAAGLSRRWSAAWAATAAVLAATTVVIVVLGAGRGPASWVVCFAAIGIAFWALAAAVRFSTGDRRRGWALTAAGLVCTLAGASLDAVAGTAMAPSLGDVAIDAVWLAAMPLFIAGIVVVDRAALRGADAGRIVVDVLVVAIASAIVLEFVVKASPVVDESALDLNVLHGGVTVGGAVAAWLLIQPVIFGRDRLRLTRLLLIGFYVGLAATNTAWMMVAGFPPNPSVALLALMLGLAAMAAAVRPPPPSQPHPPPRGFATAADLVPFLLAAGMGVAVLVTELSGQASALVLFGTLATVGLLLVRQGLLIRSSRQALAGAEARALTDPLTGLGNARAFSDRLRIEVARSARHGMPLGLLLIDVDHLKLVNDTAGHPAGDRLLRGVATQMQELSRTGDVCCRIGGDEFALLAPGSGVAAAEGLAERILAAVAELDARGTLPEPPSVSIGVAVMPEDCANRTELLDFADASLYAAKRSGRGRIGRHDPEATHDLERELERARAALLARESDFRAVFEASLDAMLITDDAGAVLDVNRALTELDGRPRSELLGRRLEDLADPRARPVVESERAEVSTGQGVTGEVDVVLVASGRRVTLEYGATQFAPGRQLIVLRDVTERRAAEAELSRREAENRAVLEALPDLTLRFDRHGVVRGVVATDREFPLALDPHAMPGRSLPELGVPADEAQPVLDQVSATLDGAELTTREYELDWAGRRRHFEARMVPYGQHEVLALVREMTERREAERARAEADERYRLVVETANEGLVLTDGDNCVLFANQRFAEMLEWSPDEIPGTNVMAFVHPEERARHARRLSLARSAITPGRFDLRLVTKSGEPLWVQVSATPFGDDSGAYAGGLTMLTDISTRKRAEEQLRESERRFRGLADAAPMMVWTSQGPDGGLDFVNQRVADFTGRPRDGHWGYGFLAAVHPDDRASLIEAAQQAWRSAAPFELEHRMRRHDGEHRWVLSSASPRFGADGTLVGYVGSALDITERRAAEEELRTSERQFRELADTAPMLIWVSDGPSGGVSFLNRSWLDFTGRTPEQEFGFGWLEGVHPEDKRELLGTAIAAWEIGGPFEVEYRLRRHDGEYRWIVSSGRPRRGPDGELLGYVGSCADITERRRSEARLARLAYADELTGLPNRRLLEERLAALTAGPGPARAMAVLYCGLDRFKLINDGLGGTAADAVLREFADRIAAAAPETALVVRHSGEWSSSCCWTTSSRRAPRRAPWPWLTACTRRSPSRSSPAARRSCSA